MENIKAGFWDSSALVPLCVRQAASANLRRLWRQSTRVTVWWGASVEIRSALARLQQEKFIDRKGLQLAVARLEVMRHQWGEIVLGERLRDVAETLPDVYGLRALDSLQLAAALIWCHERPKNRLFVCDDSKLSAAAQTVGFTVAP